MIGAHPSQRVATLIDGDLIESDRRKLVRNPIRSSTLSERRSRNGRHLAMPLTQLRFLQMKPLKSTMDRRQSSQMADGLKGRNGYRLWHHRSGKRDPN